MDAFRYFVVALALAASGPAQSAVPGLRTHVLNEPVFNGKAYVYEAGEKHPETIVLVHGIGTEGARGFETLATWLARDYHVVMFDLPGFGRSSQGNLLYSPKKYAAFVRFVTQKYVRGRFTLLGHSMGGAIALRYAASFPEDVERLVVVDAAGILHRAAYSQYLSEFGIDRLPVLGAQKKELEDIAGRALRFFESLNLAPEAILGSAALRARLLQGSPVKIAALALALEDFSPVPERIKAPTLIIWGKDDRLAPPRTGKLLAGLIPSARLTLLDRAGHVPMRDNPGAFRAALTQFLRGDAEPTVVAAAAKPTPAIPARAGRCLNQPNKVFEGRYDTLAIERCEGAVIRNAEIGALTVSRSTVTIEASTLGNATTALAAEHSEITMTGGRIAGDVAVTLDQSHLDLAGVTLVGKDAAVRASTEGSVVFSICRIDSPEKRGSVHGYHLVTAATPL